MKKLSTRVPQIKTNSGNKIPKIKLNIGCGIGLVPGFINVDNSFTLSEIQTKQGKWKYARTPKGAQFVKGDVTSLPFSDNYADYILLSHVLEHVSFHKVEQAFSEIYRVLKPGGQCMIIVPDFNALILEWKRQITDAPELNWDNYTWLMQEFYGIQVTEGEFHRCPFTKAFLENELAVAGFKDFVVHNLPRNCPFPYLEGLELKKNTLTKMAMLLAVVHK